MSETLNEKEPLLWRRCALLAVLLLIVWTVWFILRTGWSSKAVQHIVLISIDTCRADYLGCYGCQRKITPNIDAVAAESVLFRNVIVPVPITLPSHSSMLTGTNPPYHGVHSNKNEKLGDFNVTLAEILREYGYKTGAIVSTFLLNSKLGIGQGFDTHADYKALATKAGRLDPGRIGGEASRLACNWLTEHKDEKAFLFLHYYDPHTPYEPPEPFATIFADNLYAGEVAYADHCVGQVIKKLKELGIYDSTLLIITADHGEMLGEHGETEHGYFVYESAIKVPLIFKLPGRSKALEVADNAAIIDIVPTICSYIGIDAPSVIHGKDLSGCFDNKADSTAQKRYIYTESWMPTKLDANPIFAVVDGNWKYIQTTRPELYNVADDPQETSNLLTKEPRRAHLLKEHLRLIIEQQIRLDNGETKIVMDAESRRRLESLGYVGDAVKVSYQFDQSPDDPKDLIGLHEKCKTAYAHFLQQQHDRAEKLCSEILIERPDLAFAHDLLGRIAYAAGDMDGTITHYSRALSLRPETFKAYNELAITYFRQGKFAEAVTHWTEVLKLTGDIPEVHNNLAEALVRLNRPAEAIEHWNTSLKLKPGQLRALNSLGKALALQGKTHQAIEYWNKALMLDPNDYEIHRNLAVMLHRQNKTADAIEHWNEALKSKPDWPEVLNNLAWVKATHKSEKLLNPDEAVQLAQKACKLTGYEDPNFLDTLGVAYAAAGKFNKAVETAEKAIEIYTASEQEKMAEDIQKRVEMYKAEQPYRE